MIISKTPLRCSFFGGGTDFRQYYENASSGFGCVLSTALNMHVYITVNKKFDDKIRLCYAGNELVDSVEEVRHNIIREALKLTGVTRSIEIVYQADIPLSTAGVGHAANALGQPAFVLHRPDTGQPPNPQRTAAVHRAEDGHARRGGANGGQRLGRAGPR